MQAAYADRAAMANHATQHVAKVVVATRHLLPCRRARYRIADQEHLDFGACHHQQRARQPKRVVTALGAVRRVIEDEERLFHDAGLGLRLA